MRQWFYQSCNEFGWFQTSGSKHQPLGTKFNTNFYTNICRDAFGKEYTDSAIENKIQDTNSFFKGLDPGVDNVYFTHGQLDPWRNAGLQAIGGSTIIPNYGHCKDFGSINARDSAEMRDSKVAIAELIEQWIS